MDDVITLLYFNIKTDNIRASHKWSEVKNRAKCHDRLLAVGQAAIWTGLFIRLSLFIPLSGQRLCSDFQIGFLAHEDFDRVEALQSHEPKGFFAPHHCFCVYYQKPICFCIFFVFQFILLVCPSSPTSLILYISALKAMLFPDDTNLYQTQFWC